MINKLSLFGLGMAIGLTWMIAIISLGFFAMYMLKDGYASSWHENIINSVVIFRSFFGLLEQFLRDSGDLFMDLWLGFQ